MDTEPDPRLAARYGADAAPTVTPPRGAKPGAYTLKVLVTSGADRFSDGYQVVEYPHTRRRHLIGAAEATLKIINVSVAPRLQIGYVMGVGDQVPPATCRSRRPPAGR